MTHRKKFTQEGIMTLGSGHSIIMGHKPTAISDAMLAENQFKAVNLNETIDSFGLFGSDLNYNTYYPDVKPEDFSPKDTEFIEPVYRLLSECIVSKYYPTDFSVGGVLKKSMKMLIGQTVNCDHETNVGNAIGVVKSVYWQEAYTDEKTGLVIPAGINGTLKIDAKANPRLARAIMMDPPAIHSNSVTVRFSWEKSHPELTDQQFYEKIGSYDKDGKLIKRNVKEIMGYMETSLVSHGADPFAKKIGTDGKITHAADAHNVYSFSESITKNHYFFSDFKELGKKSDGVDVLHNTMVFINENEKQNIISNNQTDNEENMEELLNALFGEGLLTLPEGQEPSQEVAISCITSLIQDNARLKQEVEEANSNREEHEELVRLRDEATKNAPTIQLANDLLSTLRAEVTENYKKVHGEKADEAIINLISTSDYKTVASLGKFYIAQLEEKFPLSCTSCGSHDVSRASSTQVVEQQNSQSNKSTRQSIQELADKKLRGQN
jgi:hypothetical protein